MPVPEFSGRGHTEGDIVARLPEQETSSPTARCPRSTPSDVMASTVARLSSLAGPRAGRLRRLLETSGLSPEQAGQYVRRMQEPGALTAALSWYRALPLYARDPVGHVRVPTLHVWSTRDGALGRAATEQTRRFVDAPYRLEVLEGVPHFIPELAPARTTEFVTEHIRAHG